MTFASGSRHGMSYVAETTFGETPASPTLKPLRHNSTTLGIEKEAIESEEIRSDRQITDVRHGTRSGSGDLVSHLSYASFDDFIEAALCGTWAASADTGVTTLNAADGEFTRGTGDFAADGFVVGGRITASGFATAGNNGLFKVTAVAALTLTVTPLDGQTMAAETGGGDEQITQSAAVMAGTKRRSFSVQREFGDIGKFQVFTGVSVNTLALSIAPNSMVNATFGLWAKDMIAANAAITGSTTAAATTSSPVDSFTGAIKEGGAAIAIVTALELNLENGLESRPYVGSKTSAEPSIARSNVTGTVTAYFEDDALLQKFLNETESSISVELLDPSGNGYRVTLPRVKYMTGRADVGGEGDITIPLEFRALRDSTEETQIIIEKVEA